MAAENTSTQTVPLFRGQRGRLRLATLVLGLINLAITTCKYSTDAAKEEFYLAVVIFAFLFTLVWSTILVRGGLGSDKADLVRNADPFAHLVLGVLLLVASTFWILSVKLDDPCEYLGYWAGCSKSKYYWRVFAGVLGVINGAAYTALGGFVFTGRG